MSATAVFMFYVIYQAWDAGFHHQMKHWKERWKYDVQRLDELRGVPSGDETLCQMLDITSQTKWFYQKKLRMQKWAVLHLISKHSLNMNFLSIFFMNYWWVWEVQMKNFNQNNFLFDVGQRDWSRIRVVSDVDEKWNEWKNMLMTFINKHAPVKKKRVGRKTSPWSTPDLLRKMKNCTLFFANNKLNDESGAVTLFRTNKGQRLKRNTLFSPSNTINTIFKKKFS